MHRDSHRYIVNTTALNIETIDQWKQYIVHVMSHYCIGFITYLQNGNSLQQKDTFMSKTLKIKKICQQNY